MFEIIASLAGPLIGGMMQSDSAESAQQAQSESSAAAIAEQQRQYDMTRKDLAPWREAGGAAINSLSNLLGIRTGGRVPVGGETWEQFAGRYDQPTGRDWNSAERSNIDRAYDQYLSGLPQEFGPDPEGFGALNKKFTLADFWDDPVTKASYQQGLDQGTKALSNMAASRGSLNSGATMKALTRFGTDYTGNQAAASQARYVGDQTNLYNRLAGVAGTGQTAATNSAQMGQNTANTIGGMMTAQGNARGAAAIAGGNAMGGALSGIGNYFQQQNTLNKILGSGGGYGNYSGYSGYQGNSNPYMMSNDHW